MIEVAFANSILFLVKMVVVEHKEQFVKIAFD
jgi:hypothetical protein